MCHRLRTVSFRIKDTMDEIQAFRFLRRRRERERHQQFIQRNRNRMRSIRDKSDPFTVSDDIFKELYRVNKEMARGLVEELRPHMVEARRSTAIPIELKVLCALHFFGLGSYQKSAGSDSNLGLSQSSVSNAIEEVTAALNADEVLAKWIHFPLMQGERVRLIQKNYQSFGFPGVIGYMDGMHVAIKAPKDEDNLFLNKNSYHSINVMIVCDSEMIILNCLGRFGGSNHDSVIWNESTVKEVLVDVWASGEQCWLLGDSGYPHQPWLQTPILNAPDGSPEALYNTVHVQARSAVERCIGLLKARFRCLLRNRVLEYSPIKAGRIVNACAVLHNMCLKGGLKDANVLLEEPGEDSVLPEPLPREQMPQIALLQEARAVRQRIVNRLQP
ncbi:hypothetical protein J437_LFUL014442 [Ladona fulva]|uniref:DDE Tnp4 domain-containing protein n=1 Tax=Ladona fulva TaxID=123851 RepID=A0A8K0P391_LADFU|nr:hypothetical protein J437_LFUL014442 [Ladona fulva]